MRRCRCAYTMKLILIWIIFTNDGHGRCGAREEPPKREWLALKTKMAWKKSFLIYERNFISWQEQQESWKLCGKVLVVHFGSVDIDRVCMIGTEAHKISARFSITIMRYRISVWRNQIKVRRKFPPLSLNSSGWRELRQPHNRLYPVKVNRVFISSSFLCVFHSLLTFAFARRFRLFYSGLETFKFIQIHSSPAPYFSFVESFAYYKIFMYVKKKEGIFEAWEQHGTKFFMLRYA